MKRKILYILFCVIILFSLSGCKSKEEKAYEEAVKAAEQAEKNYQKALDDYNQLQDDIQEIKEGQERINNAK